MSFNSTGHVKNFRVVDVASQQLLEQLNKLTNLTSLHIAGLGSMFNLESAKQSAYQGLSSAVGNMVAYIGTNAPALGCTQEQIFEAQQVFLTGVLLDSSAWASVSTIQSFRDVYIRHFINFVQCFPMMFIELGFSTSAVLTSTIAGLLNTPFTGIYAPYNVLITDFTNLFAAVSNRDPIAAAAARSQFYADFAVQRGVVFSSLVALTGINSQQQAFYSGLSALITPALVNNLNQFVSIAGQGEPNISG